MAGGGSEGSNQSERDRQYCELCGKMEDLLRCGRCRSSFYCSKEHQRQDWKKHKLFCKSDSTITPASQNTVKNSKKEQFSSSAVSISHSDTSQFKSHVEPASGVSDEQEEVDGGAALKAINEEDDTQVSGEAMGSSTSRKVTTSGGRPNGQTKPPLHRIALEYTIPCMNKHGICVLDDFLGQETGDRIVCEVKALHNTGRFTDGQLVSQKSDSTRDIRGDQITWVEGKESSCKAIGKLMNKMDDLIRHCSGKLGNFRINGRTKKIFEDMGDRWCLLTAPLKNSRQQLPSRQNIHYLSEIWNIAGEKETRTEKEVYQEKMTFITDTQEGSKYEDLHLQGIFSRVPLLSVQK